MVATLRLDYPSPYYHSAELSARITLHCTSSFSLLHIFLSLITSPRGMPPCSAPCSATCSPCKTGQ